MGKTFKVEHRKTCKICNSPITIKRFRTYCSGECRESDYKIKSRATNLKRYWEKGGREEQIKIRDEKAMKPSDFKIQCLVCKKYYVQVCSHIFQVHKMTAREYKKEYGLDVKKGRIPEWYKKVKGDIAIENETFKNLKVGKKFWFKKGSKTAGRYERSPETMVRLSAPKFRKIADVKKGSWNEIYLN